MSGDVPRTFAYFKKVNSKAKIYRGCRAKGKRMVYRGALHIRVAINSIRHYKTEFRLNVSCTVNRGHVISGFYCKADFIVDAYKNNDCFSNYQKQKQGAGRER